MIVYYYYYVILFIGCIVNGSFAVAVFDVTNQTQFNIMSSMTLPTPKVDSTGRFYEYDYVIASMLPLAIQHFNERKSQYIPQLSTITNCALQLQNIAVSESAKTSVDNVLRVFDKFYKDDIHANVGINCEREIIPLLAATNAILSVVSVSGVAKSAFLSDKVLAPLFVRTAINCKDEARILGKLISLLGYTKVTLLYDANNLGDSYYGALREYFEEGKTTELTGFRLPVDSGVILNVSTMNSTVDRFLQVKSRVTIIALSTSDLISLIKFVSAAPDRVQAFNRRGSFVVFVFQTPQEAEELLRTYFARYRDFFLGAFFFTDHSREPIENLRAFLRDYETFPTAPIASFFNQVYSPANNNNETKIDSLFFARTKKLVGFAAKATYDAIMVLGLSACRADSSYRGVQFYEEILKSDFVGLSGRIRFSNVGDRNLQYFSFALVNYFASNNGTNGGWGTATVAEYNADGVARWNFSTLLGQTLDVKGARELPIDESKSVQIEYNYLVPALRTVALVEASVLGGFSALFLIVCLFARKFLLCFVCFGLGMLAFAIYLFSLDDTSGWNNSRVCTFLPLVTFFGLILGNVTLAIRTMWMNTVHVQTEIKQNDYAHLQKWNYRNVLVCAFEAIFLIVWSLADPLHWARVVKVRNSAGLVVSSVGVCTCGVAGWVLLAFVCVLQVLSFVLLFRANAGRSFYVDLPIAWVYCGKLTYLASFMSFELFLIGIPTLAAVYLVADGRFIVISTIISLHILCTLFLVVVSDFVPKKYYDVFVRESSSAGNGAHQQQSFMKNPSEKFQNLVGGGNREERIHKNVNKVSSGDDANDTNQQHSNPLNRTSRHSSDEGIFFPPHKMIFKEESSLLLMQQSDDDDDDDGARRDEFSSRNNNSVDMFPNVSRAEVQNSSNKVSALDLNLA